MTVLFCFREPKTLYDCIGFICRTQYIMCCSGFYKRGHCLTVSKRTRLYCCGVGSIAMLGLGGAVQLALSDAVVRSQLLAIDKLVLSIMACELFMSLFVFATTMLSMQALAHRHSHIYVRLAAIDERLMRDFGANLNYRKLKQKNIAVLVSVTVVYVASVILMALRITANSKLPIVLTGMCCYVFVTGGPHFTGYMHMNLTELLSIRFRLLQQLLKPQFLHWKFARPQLREQRLKSAVDMTKQLHLLILEINDVYKLSLWSALSHDFTLSTSQLFIIFSSFIGNDTTNTDDDPAADFDYVLLACVVMCMLAPFYKMLVDPVYCERAVREGRKCLRLIEMLDNWQPRRPPIRQLVNSTMCWRLEYKIQFEGGMGMPLNKTVISMFASIVFNYLLILIQFFMTQKMSRSIEKQRGELINWIEI